MRLAGFRGKSFRNGNLTARNFSGDAAAQRLRRVMRADDELHERAEAPDGGSAENMQASDGGFKTLAQPRESSEAADGLREPGCQEIVLGHIDAITGAEENVIGGALATVVQLDFDSLAGHVRGNNRPVESHRHSFQPRDEPARTRRPDGTTAEPILDGARKAANEVRPRHDLAYARRTNVGGSVEQL